MRKSDLVAFIIGFTAHLLFWFAILHWDYTSICTNGECWGVIVFDIPVSFFYSDNSKDITYASLVVGTIWWGILGVLIRKFFMYLMRAFKNEIGIK